MFVDSDGNDMYREGERLRSLREPNLSGFFLSFWVAVVGLTARTVHKATRWEGRIVLFGISLLSWVTATTYTASLAAVLIRGTEERGEFDSMQQIASFKGTICTLQALEHHIKNSFTPKLFDNLKFKAFGDFGPMLVALEEDICQAGLRSLLPRHSNPNPEPRTRNP